MTTHLAGARFAGLAVVSLVNSFPLLQPIHGGTSGSIIHARLAQNLPSSGLGSKHGSFVLALREIFVGAQTGSRLIQLASLRQKEFAFRREDINECFLEFTIKPSDVVLFSHDFPFTLGSAAARDGRRAGSAYQLPNFQRPSLSRPWSRRLHRFNSFQFNQKSERRGDSAYRLSSRSPAQRSKVARANTLWITSANSFIRPLVL
jgi:hypothetical protein